MAQIFDDLGRLVEGQKTANLTLEQIKGLIATSAKSTVGAAKPFAKGGDAAAPTDKLVKLFETYTKDFQSSVKEQQDYLKQMVDVLNDIAEKKKEPKPEKGEGKEKKDKDAPKASVWKNLDKLAKEGLKKNSIGVHDTHCEGVLKEIKATLDTIADCACKSAAKGAKEAAAKATAAKPAKPAGGGKGDIGDAGAAEAMIAAEDAAEAAATKRRRQRELSQLEITNIRTSALKSILGVIEEQILGYNVMSQVLDGVLDKERKFVQDARKLSYEIEGATKDAKDLMRTFEDIGKTSKLTGKTRQQFIDRYTKTVKMGLKDLKKAHAITVAQLNTEEQLGMEADALGDTFVDWARGLKFNEGQITEMGRGMRDVARFTGMTGDELKEVVNSSKTYVDNLKLAGTATAAQVKNIIELSANFKRVGIDGGKLMDAMTSTNKLLTANTSTFALLAKAANQAGVYGKLFSGTLLQSKSAMKSMNREFMRTLNQFGVAGDSVESIRENWEKLSDEAKARINIQLKAAFDVEAGELMGTIEAFENSSQTLADKLSNVNKKLQQNLTLEEKAVLLEEQRKLKLSASMGALTALDEAAKSAKNMGDALAKFSTRRGEFEADMNALGVAWTTESQVARGAIENAMKSVNEGLKAAGKQELTIDSSEIEKALEDPAAFRELTAKIAKAEQEASTAAKAQLDPLSSAAQTLKEINDTLRNFANQGFSTIFDSMIGKLLVGVGLIVSAILGGWAILNRIMQIIEQFKRAYDPEKYANHWDSLYGNDMDNIGRMGEESTKPGSIYTHDVRLEKLTIRMLDLLSQIKACICSAGQNPQAAATPAPAAAAKQGESKPTAVEKSMRRHQEKQMKQEKWEAKQKAKNIKAESKNVQAEKKLKSKEAKTASVPTGDFDAGSVSAMGGDMMKNAAAIAILAVGVTALGAAIVFLGKKILDYLGLDLGTIIQTAAAIAAVGAAGAAIAVGAIAVMNELQKPETQEFVSGVKTNIKDILTAAAAVLIIGPAIVLLGAAIVKLTQMVLKGLGVDLSTVFETAAVVAALAAAGGALFVGVQQAMEALEEMKDTQVFQNPQALIKPLIKGAIAVAIIGPILILLAAALVKFAQVILGAMGLDLATIGKTVAAVTALLVGVTILAAGIIAATIGLFLLGTLASIVTGPQAGLMLLGAAALLLLTPIILTLVAAVMKMAEAIMGAFGLTPAVAAKIGLQVAAIILSAAAIAGAIIGAIAGLAGLGILATQAWAWIGMIMLGAAALVALTPAILFLASAVIQMAESAISIEPAEAAATGEKVAAVLWAAAKIAAGIIVSVAALAGIGWLATQAWAVIGLIMLGAVALLALTPAVLMLASAVINLANSSIDVDPAVAKMTGEKVKAVLEAAGNIAIGVMVATAALIGIGWLALQAITMVPLLLLGAAALLILTPAILTLAGALLTMADAILGAFKLDAKKAEEIAKTTEAVITGASDVAMAIMWQVPKLALLGLLWPVAGMIAGLMFKGVGAFALLSLPVLLLSAAIIGIAMVIDKAAGGMNNAVKATQGLSDLITAASDVASNIIWQVPKLAILGALSFFLPFIIGAVWAGAGAFALLAAPVMALTISLLTMAKSLTKQFPPEEAKKIADATKTVFEAAASISECISSMQGRLFWLGVFAGIANWLAGIMMKGAKAFVTMSKPSLVLATSMLQMGRMLVSAAGGAKKIKPTVEAIKGVAEMIEAVSQVFETLHKVVGKLTKRKWFGLFGSNKLEEIAEATPKFQASFLSIITFVKDGIVRPIRTKLKDAKKIERSIKGAKAVAELIKSLDPIMDGMMKTVVPLTTKPWYSFFGSTGLQKIEAAIPQFEKSFGNIVNFVKNGVMKPMQRSFKDLKKVSATAKAAILVGDAMKAISTMMEAVSKTVIGLTERPGFLFFRGSSKLQKLEEAIKPMEKSFGTIVTFVKNGVLGPVNRAFKNLKKVQGTIQVATAIGQAVASIATVMDILANKLAPMAEAEKASWWQFWKSDKPAKLEQLTAFIPKFQGPFRAIVAFLKDGLISTITAAFPNMQEVQKVLPLVEGVGKAVSAIAQVMDDMVNKLLPMTQEHNAAWYAFWDSDEPSQFDKLLEQLPTIRRVWQSLVVFVRDGLIVPVMAAFPQIQQVETALKGIEMIGTAVSTVADIMETLSELREVISPGWSGIFSSLYGGVSPLEASIPTIRSTFYAVSRFVQEGIVNAVRALNVQGLSKSVQKLKLMAQAMELMEDMIDHMADMVGLTQGTMRDTGRTTGILWWKKAVMESVAPVTTQIQNAIPSIRQTFTAIMNFVKDGIIAPVQPLAGMNLKGAIKIMTFAAKAIELIPEIIGNLNDAFDELLVFTNSRFGKSGAQNTEIASRYKGWFEWIAYFVREAIIQPMNNLGEVGALKAAGKKMGLAAKILEALPIMIGGLDDAMSEIIDFTNSKFAKTGAENWNISERYKGWFQWIAYFVREGVVKPMAGLGEIGELKTVGKKMQWAAVILTAFPKIVHGLNDAMNAVNFLAASKFLKTQEENTAIAARYRGWFEWVAYFVRSAIIIPSKGLGEVRELQTVAKIMCAAANILVAFPKIVRGLNGAMDAVNQLAASKFLTTQEENTAIAARYRGWFEWVAYFVRRAIIEPAKGLGDVQELAVTAKAVMYAEKILSATPRVIIGLGKAMDEINNLAEDKFTYSQGENTRIAARYRGWFEWVAYFVRVALVEPVLKEFPDIKKLMDASRIISAMQRIIAAVPKIIIGLAQTMGLMSGSSQYLDDDFPMDKIMMYKDQFAIWFRRIAIFLRDGIVDPILTEIPEPKTIMLAQRILTAMNAIIRTVPNIIRGTAAAMGLMSGSTEYMDEDFPMDKIMMYKNTFAVWFRNIAAFIRDGIVDPILTELPDPKTIMLAQRILTAMNAIISRLPTMIRNLSRMFMPMNPDDCIADSPIAMLAQGVEQFKAWFRSITSFLREGIIWPIIDSMPTEEEIVAAETNLAVTVAVLRAVPPFIQNLSDAVFGLVSMIMGQPFLGAFTEYAASWFGGIATSLNNGIITPIRLMPSSEEFTEIVAQLDGLSKTVQKTTEVCNAIAESIGPLVSGWWWFSPIASIGRQASKFAYYWEGISQVLNEGIITPIKKNLPPSSEIEEAAARINSLADVLMGLKTSLELLAEIMQDLQGMNIDMETLRALPLAELAAIGMGGGAMSKANGAATTSSEAVNSSTPTEQVQDDKVARKEQEAATSMSKDMDQFMITAITPGNGIYVTDLALIQTIKEIFKDGIEVSASVTAQTAKPEQSVTQVSEEQLKKNIEEAERRLNPNAAQTTQGTGPLSQARNNALGQNQGAGTLSGALPRGAVRPAMDRASGGINPAVVMPRGNQMTPEERMQRMSAAANRTGANSVNPYTQRRDALASQRATERGAERQSIEAAQARIAEQQRQATGAVGAEGRITPTVTPTATAVPPTTDIHSQVRQNAASNEPAATQVNSPELSEIAAAATEETELSKQMVTLLEQMLKIFKGEGSKAGSGDAAVGDTSPNKVGQKPAYYARWPAGKHFQSGGKQILNIGSQIV